MTDPPWPLWAPRRPLRRRRGGTFLPSLLSATLAALAFSVAPAAIAFSPPPSGSGPPLPRRQPNKPEPRPRSRPPSAASPDAVDAAYYGSPTAESSAFSSERLEAAARSSSSSAPAAAGGAGGGGGGGPARVTLTRWLSAKVQDYPELRDMESLHLSIQMACKTISNLIHSSTSDKLGGRSGGGGGGAGAGGGGGDLRDDSMKRLDQISKNVLQNALRFTGRLRVVEAPRSTGKEGEEGPAAHQPGVTIAYALDQYGRDGGGGGGGSRKQRGGGEDGDATARAESKWGTARRLAACFDPLDGSGNADAALCTGTVVSSYVSPVVSPRFGFRRTLETGEGGMTFARTTSFAKKFGSSRGRSLRCCRMMPHISEGWAKRVAEGCQCVHLRADVTIASDLCLCGFFQKRTSERLYGTQSTWP
ncbi:hypothetical protein ACHAWF_003608 [Thalassiosira exigua]